MRNNICRNENGITLIALVVTIIVLIILASVTIPMIIGNNGIIGKAKQAVDLYISETAKEEQMIKDYENMLKSSEKSFKLGIGWNLGNSLDCRYEDENYSGKTVTNFETHWGNPTVTKELIEEVHKKGFDTIRIPVTWYQHLDLDNKIDTEWLARVKEVVDYSIDAGMVVILNTHHENWLTFDGSLSETEIKQRLNNEWLQIAEAFKNYDNDKLIFEILNEPRNIGAEDEWSGNSSSYTLLNSINVSVLSTIRSTGGNNSTRFVMIPAYAASSSSDKLGALTIPEDAYIIVSVHDYVSSTFKASNGVYDTETKKTVARLFDRLSKYQAIKNVKIILSEIGTYYKDDEVSHINWAKDMAYLAGKNNIPVMIWDNGSAYKLIDRSTLQWVDINYVNAFVNSYKKGIEDSSKTEVNKIADINTTENISYNNTTTGLTMSYNTTNDIRHFIVSTTNEFTSSDSLRFKFNDTYSINDSGSYTFSGKVNTSNDNLKIKLVMYFYDEDGNTIYTVNYDDLTSSIVDGSSEIYDFSKTYFVEGATSVKVERLSISSEPKTGLNCDIYDLKLTDGDLQ